MDLLHSIASQFGSKVIDTNKQDIGAKGFLSASIIIAAACQKEQHGCDAKAYDYRMHKGDLPDNVQKNPKQWNPEPVLWGTSGKSETRVPN
jgi:hypothetical protein